MAVIPKDKLENLIDNRLIEQKDRTYLGYSSLGHECKRALWYGFRWADKRYIPRRIERLFRRGDYEEDVIIEDLEHHGMVVFDQQFEVEGFEKHVLGHIDGIVTRVPDFPDDELLLLEMKTAKQEMYRKYKKDGVQLTNFTYYCQMQSYMGKLGLKHAMFIMTNKNTEERYHEYVDFVQEQFDRIEAIAEDIVSTDVPPPKIGDAVWYSCKICSYKDVCHKGKKYQRTCRTCQYGTILPEGKWKCGRFSEEGDGILPEAVQREGCDLYELLETLNG